MNISLEKQQILVTGASRGIGKAIATHLSKAGARVAIHFHQQKEAADELAKSLGRGAEAFKADLSKGSECIRLFEEVVRKFGHLDGLVNNAGIALQSPINGENEKWLLDWENTMAVNLRASGVLSRSAIQHFLPRGNGRIVHIASRASFRGDTPEYLAYAASKGGIVSLSRSIARAYGKQGIKSFIIAPGFVRTDMAQDFMDEYGEDFAVKDIALERLTEPDDVAPFVTFLCSGLADHATGGTFDINAGSYVH